MTIEEKYRQHCHTPSDINKHLVTLRKYADECDHVTEIGVRGCVSLYAFLSSNASKVVAIDIHNVDTPDVEKLKFICADDLTIEIEPTDLLFIDTAHNANQLRQELKLHAGNVRKYIFFHDTFYFGRNGDDGGEGLLYAIEEFLHNNPEWKQFYHTDVNNGLTGLKRI
jgi:hypothetical protein